MLLKALKTPVDPDALPAIESATAERLRSVVNEPFEFRGVEEVVEKIKLFAVVGFVGVSLMGVASTPSMAIAQDPAGETTYDFDDDLVSGDLVRPDGEMLNVRRRGRRSSLIRIREHFVPEMLKSVEDL